MTVADVIKERLDYPRKRHKEERTRRIRAIIGYCFTGGILITLALSKSNIVQMVVDLF